MADKTKKFCQTTIPKDWPQFYTPTWTPGMSVQNAIKAWSDHLRRLQRIGPTPRVYRKGEK